MRLLVGLPNLKSRWSILCKEIRSALRAIADCISSRRNAAQKTLDDASNCIESKEDAVEVSRTLAQFDAFLLNTDQFLTNEQIKDCAAVTALASYSELKQLSEDVVLQLAQEKELTAERFTLLFKSAASELAFDVRLPNYFKRVGGDDDTAVIEDKPPVAEILDNAWLMVETQEVNRELPAADRNELKKLLKCLCRVITQKAGVIDDDELIKWLTDGATFPEANSDLKQKMSRIADALGVG